MVKRTRKHRGGANVEDVEEPVSPPPVSTSKPPKKTVADVERSIREANKRAGLPENYKPPPPELFRENYAGKGRRSRRRRPTKRRSKVY